MGHSRSIMPAKPNEERLRLGLLLRRARKQLGLRQAALGKHLQMDARTVRRWENGETRPTLEWRAHVASELGNVDGETWRAIVAELGMPLEAALERVPAQRAKLPTPPPTSDPSAAPTGSIAARTTTPDDARALLDDAVRTNAEDLDVSARRLRAAIAAVLADVERLGLTPSEARSLIQGRSSKRAVT